MKNTDKYSMWKTKILLIFYALILNLMVSCGEGFLAQDDIDNINASSPEELCPPPLSASLKPANIINSPALNFISEKIRITTNNIKNQSEMIKLSVTVDKQCVQFISNSLLAKKIITTSLTADIPLLTEQSYAYTILKSHLSQFQKKVKQDFCIKSVSLNRSFTLIKGLRSKQKHLSKQTLIAKQNFQKTSSVVDDFNDTFILRQSHLWAVSAFAAFKEFFNSTYGLLSTDPKTIVAIVDSPLDRSHEDLSGVILTTSDISDVVAFERIRNSKDHGTHVAGLVAAISNNNKGTIGLSNKAVKLLGIGVTQADGRITQLDLTNQLNAINSLSPNLKPQVVNLSLEATVNSCSENSETSTAIKNLLNSGVSVVVAAGNGTEVDGVNNVGQRLNATNFLRYPACLTKTPGFEALITVGSVDVNNDNTILRISAFSNYSSDYISIGAPGSSSQGGLYSTIVDDKYGWIPGTSQATPLVTSAVALSYSILNKIREDGQSVFAQCSVSLLDKPKIIKNLVLSSATKDGRFIDKWKDGNLLNLDQLIKRIHFVYPNTKKE